jgi:hypothetical protein
VKTLRNFAGSIVAALAVALWSVSPAFAAAPSIPAPLPTPAPSHVPVLAYYYIWFNTASWSHAKTDLPALGAYTSTDPAVIRQHVTWAKESGIDAFIVSWKNTPSLDQALAELVAECRSQGLKLVLLYEGLDVNRNPIGIGTVEEDLVWFMSEYGNDPVFDVFGKPAIVWSGTWRFSDADVSAVRSLIGAPNGVLLLGSEKGASAYTPRASLFDGDAYYWSSGDPLQTPGYETRLMELGQAVHAAGGLWLAPAAPGFDAQLNGGTSVVDRRDGATLRAGWADAQATNPDAMAVISWNEFTENSYVEPSQRYGLEYLQLLASLTGASGPTPFTPTPQPSATGAPSPTASPSAVTVGGTTGHGPSRPSTPVDYTPELAVSGGALLLIVLLGVSFRRRAGRALQ